MEKSLCIHHQNIQRHLIEICKAFRDVSENSLIESFVRGENIINLRSKAEPLILSVNSFLKGKNSLRCFGSVLRNSLPIEIREDHLILSSVTKIK